MAPQGPGDLLGSLVAAYRRLAERLKAEVGLEPTDLIVSVVANERADWSFGLGRAQFLEGDL